MFNSTREIADRLRTEDVDERDRLLDELEADEVAPGVSGLDALRHDWTAWGRPEQQLPTDPEWRYLFLRAGRGGGKTRAGAEMTLMAAMEPEECGGRIALIAPTHADIRGTMVEGTSGILACAPPWFMPQWQPGVGNGRLVFPGAKPATGQSIAVGDTVIANCYSADKPDRIRGPETGWLWGDEIAAWGVNGQKVHDTLDPGLRYGTKPRGVYTSTPRPTAFVEWLDAMARQDEEEIAAGKRQPDQREFIQRIWSTWRNAKNLSEMVLRSLRRRFAGTAQGQQELEAQLLVGDPGAMWQQHDLDRWKVTPDQVPEMAYICVAVDNATEAHDGPRLVDPDVRERNRDGKGADTGILPVGLGVDGLIYFWADRSTAAGPDMWAKDILDCFADPLAPFYGIHPEWRDRMANEVIIERNGGGALIESTLALTMAAMGISRHRVPTTYVRAKDGKDARAEPVVALYRQGRVRHVRWPQGAAGSIEPLADYEFQQTRFKRGRTGYKKDRVDAAVYGATACAEQFAAPDAREDVAARYSRY